MVFRSAGRLWWFGGAGVDGKDEEEEGFQDEF
jgi:hypothetical protein